MAGRLRLVSLLGLLLATTAGAQTPAPDDAAVRFARSSNGFGFALYGKLRSTPGNLVVSPASVTTALAMAWGGARGQTAEEMQAVLRSDRLAAETIQASGLRRVARKPLDSEHRPGILRTLGAPMMNKRRQTHGLMRAADGGPAASAGEALLVP